jgi:isoquinoline 1-oxidoreductase beta subunit
VIKSATMTEAGTVGGEPAQPQRRFVLKSGGGLVIAFALGVPRAALGFASGKPQAGDPEAARLDGNPAFAPNAFIRIGSDGIVRLVMPEVEMGQGAYLGQATLIAEELCVDLDQVRLEHAPPNEALYALELQGEEVTGGSATIRGTWMILREAGAVARTMLVGAAAARWGVPADQCHVERGVVHPPSGGRSLGYGELAAAAAKQPVPQQPELLSAKSHRLIGQRLGRPDTAAKSNGSIQYGIDARVPGMRIAAVAIAPTVGGRVRKVDDRRARAVAGVIDVVVLDDAVAVTAGDFWTARKGVAALAIDWDLGPNASMSTDGIAADMARVARDGAAIVAKSTGHQPHGMARQVEATYTVPMLAHATMEPMNALVSVRKDACEIWTGTQVPARAQASAAKITGLPPERVSVYNHYIGGGFGRRLEYDITDQAVRIAMKVSYPVKLVWTREQDIALDYYRPPYHDHLVATLDDKGFPSSWRHRDTSDSVSERWAPASMGKDGLDGDSVDAAAETPYALPNQHVEWVRHHLPEGMRTGWWRGVGATHNLFVVESFIDELAHAGGHDPVDYRRALLAQNPKGRALLDAVAARFGWGKPMPARTGCGVAIGVSMATLVCAMVEVEVTAQGDIRLRRAVAGVDCGTVVNPNMIEAQIKGGLVFGWSAALYGEVTYRDGRVEQHNFNDYRVLRMGEAPAIEGFAMPSSEPPTGIGEPPCAIAAPCLANAVFAATGVRVRELPLKRALLASSASAFDRVVS